MNIKKQLWHRRQALQGSLSDKALFYRNLKPGTVLLIDDITLSDPLEEVARTSMTYFQDKTPHYTLDKDKKPIVRYIPERAMWLLANVDNELDLQTVNRMVDVTVDEGGEADLATWRHQARSAEMCMPKFPETLEVHVCRELLRIIHEDRGPFDVVIPWATKIKWTHTENRRNFETLLDSLFSAFL